MITQAQLRGDIKPGDTLIEATDEVIANMIPEYSEVLPNLIAARRALRNRRFTGS